MKVNLGGLRSQHTAARRLTVSPGESVLLFSEGADGASACVWVAVRNVTSVWGVFLQSFSPARVAAPHSDVVVSGF